MTRTHPFYIRDGVWYARIKHHGHPHRVSLGLHAAEPWCSLSPAELAVAELPTRLTLTLERTLEARRDELIERAVRHPLRPAIDSWLSLVTRTRRAATATRYHRQLEAFLDFASAHSIRHLDQLAPAVLADYSASLLTNGRSPRGINSDLRALKSCLNSLHRRGLLPRAYNSAAWFRDALLPEPPRRDRVYSAPELRVLFADSLYGDIYEGLYLLGCRVGVLLRLDSGCIVDDLIRLPRGKRGQLHDIPLTPQFRDFLIRRSLAPGGADIPVCAQYLFWRWPLLKPDSPDDLREAIVRVNRRLNRVLDAHDYQPGRVHDLRATCATHLVAAGLSMPALMQYIGWINPATALRYYRPRPADLTIPQLPAAQSCIPTANLQIQPAIGGNNE